MATLIEYGQTLCAIGLDWESTHAGEFSRKQIAKRRARFKATHYVAHETTEPSGMLRSYGFARLPKLTKAERKSGVFSLASVLARQSGDSFCVVVPLGDGSGAGDQLGFVGVLKGMPGAGLDLVGPRDEIQQEVQQFLDKNQIAHYYYLKDFGDPELSLEGKSASEFDHNAPDGPQAIDPSSKLLAAPNGTLLMLVVLLGMMSVATVGGILLIKQQRDDEAMNARNQITPEQSYVLSRNSDFEARPRIPANVAYNLLDRVLLDLPLVQRKSAGAVSGWALDKVSCEVAKDGETAFECNLIWVPYHGGTYDEFVSPLSETKITFDTSLGQVNGKLILKFDNVKKLAAADIPDLPSSLDFIRSVGSLLQDLKELEFTPRLANLQAVGALPGPKFPGALHSLSWELSGPAPMMSLAMTALPPSITLEKFEFIVPNGAAMGTLRISTSGVAYVR